MGTKGRSIGRCYHPDCIAPITNYGFQHCYMACDNHEAWGRAIEAELMAEYDRFKEQEQAEWEANSLSGKSYYEGHDT